MGGTVYTPPITRGEIYYITSIHDTVGSEQRAGRPALIVSNNKGNQFSPIVEICYLTMKEKPPLPTHITIESGPCGGSIILCEQITTVSIERVGDFMCKLSDSTMDKVDRALMISLDLNPEMVTTDVKSVPSEDYEKFSAIEKENTSLKEDKISLEDENLNLKKELAYLSDKVHLFEVEASQANMYKTMYYDIIDRLVGKR